MKRLLLVTILVAIAASVSQNSGGTGNNWFPQWSHDGKRLALSSDGDGLSRIYSMNSDGSNVVLLTGSPK